MQLDPTDLILIITAIVGSSGLTWLFTLRSQNQKIGAEAQETSAKAWATLVENLQRRVTILEQAGEEKDQRINDLQTEVDDLRAFIEKQGLTPPPRRSHRPDKE